MLELFHLLYGVSRFARMCSLPNPVSLRRGTVTVVVDVLKCLDPGSHSQSSASSRYMSEESRTGPAAGDSRYCLPIETPN